MNTIPLVKNNSVKDINTSILALKNALDYLQTKSSADKKSTDIDTQELQSLIDEINRQIQILNTMINQFGSDITNINYRLNTLTTGLSTLEGRVNGIDESITTINNSITSINSSINTINGQITSINSDISGIKTRLTTAEGNITTLQGNISTINSQITTLQGNITTINNTLTTISGQITSLNTRIGTAESNITTLQGNISTINSHLTTIDGQISDLQPIDSVTDGSMKPVTSNAVYDAISTEVTNRNTAITNAINNLDVSSVGGSGKYISTISETNGKISATAGNIDSTPTNNSSNPVSSGGVYNALQNISAVESALPYDSIIHYSFDELPNVPNGTASYRHNKDWSSADWSRENTNFTQSIVNGCLTWSIPSFNLNCIIHANNMYLAVGNNGTYYKSTDGSTWTKQYNIVSNDLTSIAYGNSIYFAIGPKKGSTGGALLYSTDGTSWTNRQGGWNHLVSICYTTNNWFYFVTDNLIYRTSNGNTVQQMSVTNDENLNYIAYLNGKYIALGNNGTIITSNDGTTWTQRTSGTTNNLNSIAYLSRSGLYVAVGDNGTILSSTDCITWTSRSSGTTNNLNSIVMTNSYYVIVGDLGTILLGTSLTSLTQQTSNTVYDLKSIVYYNGNYVLVGDNILKSTTDPTTWDKTIIGCQANTYISNKSNKLALVKIHVEASDDSNLGWRMFMTAGGGFNRFGETALHNGDNITQFYIPDNAENYTIMQLSGGTYGDTFTYEYLYIGNGSDSTPIIDNSGNGFHATNGGLLKSKGVSGSAGASSNGLLTLTNFSMPKNYSVSFWVKSGNATSGLNGIFSVSNVLDFYFTNSTSYYGIYSLQSGGFSYDTTGFSPSTQYALVVFTYDGTNIKSYYNGAYVKTLNISVPLNTQLNTLWLGGSRNTRASYIDDFQLFDRVLSDNEIMALYFNRGNTPKYYSYADYRLDSSSSTRSLATTSSTKGTVQEEETKTTRTKEEEYLSTLAMEGRESEYRNQNQK